MAALFDPSFNLVLMLFTVAAAAGLVSQ